MEKKLAGNAQLHWLRPTHLYALQFRKVNAK